MLFRVCVIVFRIVLFFIVFGALYFHSLTRLSGLQLSSETYGVSWYLHLQCDTT